ncbi:hypothetical protein GCM10020295_40840 [Streptomyces cinereospinus]
MPYGFGVGCGWYGVWTPPCGGAGAAWSTGGNTAEPTPAPLWAGAPGTMLGGAAWKEAATRRHSPRMASAVGKRSFGFFLSARAISASTAGGSERLIEDAAGGSSCTCAYAMASGESASNGNRPVTSWNSMMPTEYRSERASTPRPSACSGERYCGVPTTMPVWVIEVTPDCMARAMPKSMTLTTPRLVTITLPGLMSRWTRPISWLTSSAASTSAVTFNALSTGIAPYCRTSWSSTEPSGRPSTYSMTMYGVGMPSPAAAPPSDSVSSPVSKTETMLVCVSFATACASRRNRSRNACSRPSSVCRVLMAT